MMLSRYHLPITEAEIKDILQSLQRRKVLWRGCLCPANFPKDPHDVCSIVFYFPYLFRSLIDMGSRANQEKLRLFSEASILFAYSIFTIDKIIDNQYEQEFYFTEGPIDVLRLPSLYLEAFDVLYSLFPKNSHYFESMRESIISYIQAALIEREFSLGKNLLENFTLDVAIDVIHKKNRMFENIPLGLSALFERDLNSLVESVKRFMVSEQLIDDLQDWKKDLTRKTPSLILARVVTAFPEKVDSELLRKLSVKIFYENHDEYICKIALENIDAAEKAASGMNVPEWKKALALKRKRIELFLEDTRRMKRNQDLKI